MINRADAEYNEMLQLILNYGNNKDDRTGTGTRSLFGLQMRFDLSKDGFPLLTTKKVHWHSVVTELLWFLRGDTNIKYLQDNNVRIWNEWATEDGEIGPMYGKQWRKWECYTDDKSTREPFRFEVVDQIANLVDNLRKYPDSRRHVVSAWNVADVPNDSDTPQDNVEYGDMALAPCHFAFQCYVNDGKLSMQVYQRSMDFFLGTPFNIASYALLTHMLAQVCDLEVGELILNGGDCHIYNNHFDQVKEQLNRYMDGKMHQPPRLELNSNIKDIDLFTHDDIHLHGYTSEPTIKAPIAV